MIKKLIDEKLITNQNTHIFFPIKYCVTWKNYPRVMKFRFHWFLLFHSDENNSLYELIWNTEGIKSLSINK